MRDVRSSAISRKLTWMVILVSGVALVSACTAFFLYDQYTFRESLVHSLSAQAEIIGANSVSALTFNDPQSAENTLAALRSLPNIIAAEVVTADGQTFARYSRIRGVTTERGPYQRDAKESHEFREDRVRLQQPILFQGRQIGMVYICSDLGERTRRLNRYLLIAGIVLLGSLIMALIVSSAFRRSVAEPIVQLAETARVVSQEQNYAIRATATGGRDEMSVLIRAFNDMLSQIQRRDTALQRAREDLEQRVDDRTRQLVAANRELEAFSYSVSHDLRGPLEVINGFSHILANEHGSKLDQVGRDCVQQINQSTHRMSELIEDLLNLSRVSTTTMHHEKMNLAIMARGISEQLWRREPERNVEFLIHDCPTVEGDARLLRIVLENLLRNAWKYTSHNDSAHIEFGCQERRGRNTYYVRDDGAGFDPAQESRLFKPFQRLHSTSEFPGSGIGLATVQRIISRHGGEVWAEGAINKGATFYFTL